MDDEKHKEQNDGEKKSRSYFDPRGKWTDFPTTSLWLTIGTIIFMFWTEESLCYNIFWIRQHQRSNWNVYWRKQYMLVNWEGKESLR